MYVAYATHLWQTGNASRYTNLCPCNWCAELNPTLANAALHPFRCRIQIHKDLVLSAYAAWVLFIWRMHWSRLCDSLSLLQPAEFMFACFLQFNNCQLSRKICVNVIGPLVANFALPFKDFGTFRDEDACGNNFSRLSSFPFCIAKKIVTDECT